MCIMMFCSLYLSRILLKELGIDDYGIYSIVGGLVAIFSSLRSLFATATERFLNYEMGMDSHERMRVVFNMSILLHFIICIIFLLIAEPVGLWLLNYKLVIAAERIEAANVAFQFSILASLVTIMTIPFDAVIIANEKMNVFAYLSIVDAVLKIGIVLLLSISAIDKLKLYSILIFASSLLMRLITTLYCRSHFRECKYKFIWDKQLFRKMGYFAGWNFAGNLIFSLVNEGLNILLNIFGGVVANAARGIAYQVKNAITTLLNNVMIAVQPQATMLYAQGESAKFFTLLFSASKFLLFLYLCIAFPLYVYTEEILAIWLVQVPEYSVSFIQLLLIYLLFRALHAPIDSFFLIIGHLKTYQLTEFIVLGISLPLSYISLKFFSFPLCSVFLIMAIVELINLLIVLHIAQKIGNISIRDYMNVVIYPFLKVLTIAVICVLMFDLGINEPTSFFYLIACVLGLVSINLLCVYYIGLTKKEKEWILLTIKNKSPWKNK